MRWLLYALAAIGAVTVLVGLAVLALAGIARRGERLQRQSWRDEHLLRMAREHGPEVVAENPSLWDSYVAAHGLRAPRGWRP